MYDAYVSEYVNPIFERAVKCHLCLSTTNYMGPLHKLTKITSLS